MAYQPDCAAEDQGGREKVRAGDNKREKHRLSARVTKNLAAMRIHYFWWNKSRLSLSDGLYSRGFYYFCNFTISLSAGTDFLSSALWKNTSKPLLKSAQCFWWGQRSTILFSNPITKIKEDRVCIILRDKIYVKQGIRAHAGELFGYAHDHTDQLAKTCLCIYVFGLKDGPRFIACMIPCAKLYAAVLSSSINYVIYLLHNIDVSARAVICDGARINQAQIKQELENPEKPMRSLAGIFYMFDYVQILKNVRVLPGQMSIRVA